MPQDFIFTWPNIIDLLNKEWYCRRQNKSEHRLTTTVMNKRLSTWNPANVHQKLAKDTKPEEEGSEENVLNHLFLNLRKAYALGPDKSRCSVRDLS